MIGFVFEAANTILLRHIGPFRTDHYQDNGTRVDRFPDNVRKAHPWPDRLDVEKDDAARARYAEATPELFQRPPNVGETNYGAAIDLAHLLSRLGDGEMAEALLRNAREITAGRPRAGPAGIGFFDIKALALLGNNEAALAALEEAASSEWLQFWWQVPSDPNLSTLHQHPRFDAVIERFRSRAAEYRANTDVSEGSVR